MDGEIQAETVSHVSAYSQLEPDLYNNMCLSFSLCDGFLNSCLYWRLPCSWRILQQLWTLSVSVLHVIFIDRRLSYGICGNGELPCLLSSVTASFLHNL